MTREPELKPSIELTRRLAEHYTSEAEAYKELWAPALYPFGRSLLETLPLAEAHRILEVGSGIGLLLPDVSQAAPRALVMGVDRSEGMLNLSPSGFNLAVMDASRLALLPARFDIALMVFMLFHLPRPSDGLSEVRRVLRPGGTLGTVTWGKDPGFPALDVWNEELQRHGARTLDPATELSQHSFMDTTEKVQELLRQAGYVSIETWTQMCEYGSGLEEFIARRTQIGMDKRRLETLKPQARALCVRRVRERLACLSGENFRMHREVIFATATASRAR